MPMGKITLTPSSAGRYELSQGCMHCAGSEQLKPRQLRLYKSTALQLLAIPAFFLGGSAFKTTPSLLIPAFGLALLFLSLGQLKVTVQTAICGPCRKRRGQLGLGVAACFLAGLALLLWSSASYQALGSLSGAILTVGGVIAGWALTRDSDVTLLGKQGEEVSLNVPEHKPAAWSSREPHL